jgi:hypothetical protein
MHQTPLHILCKHYVNKSTLDVFLLLLEAWLDFPENRNLREVETLKYSADGFNNDLLYLLWSVSTLFCDEINVTSLKLSMELFIEIKWQKGIWLVINKYPAIIKKMDLHTNVMADLLYKVGKKCGLMKFWEMLQNEQELLKGVKFL